MEMILDESWERQIGHELNQPYFLDLLQFVENEYKQHQCYPPSDAIFSAFTRCTFEQTKVVILGQDPYHGPDQAHGLCFSVPDGIPYPPSLKNIFKELESDIGKPYPKTGNLESWVRQGVLLLNATLTVRAQHPGSHQNRGWEIFTDKVIQTISEKKEGVVFLLWGGFAKKKASMINASRHHILISGHPSPLSANRGLWFGNRHFSKVNEILQQSGQEQITW